MRIINIIDNISQVNFGIWNAAIATAKHLKESYHVISELWFPEIEDYPNLDSVTMIPLKDTSKEYLFKLIEEKGLSPNNTIIVTHGCWQYATKWGAELKNKGFHWVYTPHGMLEPWSMQQKKWKKKIYFKLLEYPLSKIADTIRAVGSPELKNLQNTYNNTILIPNGIEENITTDKEWSTPIQFLFMARLHHKKGILALVQAWITSSLNNNEDYILNIAGPDDGEKEAMLSLIQNNNNQNIKYTGAIYGSDKEQLLKQSHFYILPSHSEGFPTSVLEAMQYGLIPIITKGCNFPEVFKHNKAIEITTSTDSIVEGLQKAAKIDKETFQTMSKDANEYINQNYSLKIIAKKQYELYQELLS